MLANRPVQVATPSGRDARGNPENAGELEPALAATEGFGTVVLDQIGQLLCAMQGHDHMLQHTEGRVFLRCVTCGHESPGWDVPTRVRATHATATGARRTPALPIGRVA